MTSRDALHMIALLKCIDIAVCMDSGVLWGTHAAKCPIVCLLGPTPTPQRLSFHPLWPTGVRDVRLEQTVELNGKVGCEPCFELAKACKQSYACLQGPGQNWENVINVILGKIEELQAPDLSVFLLPVIQ